MTEAKQLTTLRTFKDVQKFMTDLGCGSHTHLLTKEVDGKIEPTGEMFWRISSHMPKVLIEAVATLKASHFKIRTPEVEAIKDEPIAKRPSGVNKKGEAAYLFYIDVPFTYDKETQRGERPRIVLGREG